MIIGKNLKTNKEVKLDLEKLISTRLLIQANSGGGKSWLLRKILEESHGKVQQIILDLEGEFSTLRDEYDYLLCGRDGDIPIHIKTADLLARKILELNVSAIVDISELKKHERILFIKRFLDSLMDAPRRLWHPCIIAVDEAHQFCPQTSKSESASSIIDLMTRGRKRGFCGILATQRIAKLHKDAAAEANNHLVGRTGQDVDRKRAADDLGFNSREQERSLRELEDGEFHAFGPAISREVIKMKVGGIKTKHPEPGSSLKESSPTPDNIKKILKDVIDLPKEVEEELKTKQDMQKKISDLKREIRVFQLSKPEPKIDEKSIERSREQGFKDGMNEANKETYRLEQNYKQLEKKIIDVGKIVGQEVKYSFEPKTVVQQPKSIVISSKPVTQVTHQVKPDVTPVSNGSLRAGAMKMLNWLAGAYPNSLTKQKIATLSGFSVKGGTFNTYLSELKRNGWIVGSNELSITEDGLQNATTSEIPSGEQLLQLWKSKFREGAGNILQFIYESYPNGVSKEEIADSVISSRGENFEVGGGTFNTYLSELRRNGLIKVEGGQVSISPEFFE